MELFQLDKAERMRIYGRELRRRRIEAGFEELKEFAARISVSNQHLSQVETAYSRAGRPSVGLGDEAMEAVAKELGWRVIDQRHMLGQVPTEEIDYIFNPDTVRVAEAYDGAPESIRRAFDALADTVKPTRKTTAERVEEIEREGRHGVRPKDD